MKLYLLRHPQPEIAPGICYGSSDLTVAAAEHQRALTALRGTLPLGLPLYSSPLRRCSEFAALLVSELQVPVVIHDARLVEMHFGTWEMQAWAAIARDEVNAWAADVTSYCPGGGEGVLAMATRVGAFYDDILASGQSAIVVCHAGTMRLLHACAQGGSPHDAALRVAQERMEIRYGQLRVLDC
jgi:alpha-ribazole phosphatase